MWRLLAIYAIGLGSISAVGWGAPVERIKSSHSVKDTTDRLETLARSKGLTIFQRIDHRQNAKRAGLEMPASEVLIFGNPKAGTALMNENPEIALDLPLKILVYEAKKNGQVFVQYQSTRYLKERYNIKKTAPVLSKVSQALEALTAEAVR